MTQSPQQRFDQAMTDVLSVSRKEMKRRLAEAKAENKARREAVKARKAGSLKQHPKPRGKG